MTNGSWPPPIHNERMREYFGWTDMGLEMSVCACQPPPQYCDSPSPRRARRLSPDLMVYSLVSVYFHSFNSSKIPFFQNDTLEISGWSIHSK